MNTLIYAIIGLSIGAGLLLLAAGVIAAGRGIRHLERLFGIDNDERDDEDL